MAHYDPTTSYLTQPYGERKLTIIANSYKRLTMLLDRIDRVKSVTDPSFWNQSPFIDDAYIKADKEAMFLKRVRGTGW